MRKLVKQFKKQEGYTIVELLAVTAIFVIISGLIAGILYSTLRGGSKTRVTNDVSQSGNFALSVMSNTILSSENVTKINGLPIDDCTAFPSGSSVELKTASGAYVTFACLNNSIASTSGNTTTYLVDSGDGGVVAIPSQTCSFTCRQENNNSYANPIVDINFEIQQKLQGAGVDSSATTPFFTSTVLRNYNP